MVNFDFMERYHTMLPRYTRFGTKLNSLFGFAIPKLRERLLDKSVVAVSLLVSLVVV
jgi:hypothetical protein